MARKFDYQKFEETPIVGIMRNLPPTLVEAIVPLYQKAGYTTLEVTMNSKGAQEMISLLSQKYPELNIGAGTVCSMADLKKALSAGASFIVTPILNDDVMDYCKKNGIPFFPGAFSPSEIYRAWSKGASAVKIFPATQLGPGFIKDILGPLNQIKVLPTGGVTKDNISDFLNAGAIGAGMGSTLFDKKLIANENFEGLYEHFVAIRIKAQEITRNSQTQIA